ncbi:hypothetical protein DFQ28_000196 [Apophysomyces sp. BC1034]|nr:hypothetical protein DFQ30_000256 [Apophysomyces sp. BC1015]KAG0176070.1 hypothetical protein DFQ29_006607 [Apophysomyces sp. BC1021]KAG0191425.1 hypothetical protein DFQ28_000196 [Apophysomyces sp. BC1034]
MTSQMLFYIRDRHLPGGPKQIYDLLFIWNERPGTKTNDIPTETSPAIIRRNAWRWLARAIGQLLLSVPIMSTADGFLRVCTVPPETATYLDWRRLYYYTVVGFTLHLHVAIIPLLSRLFQSVVLVLTCLVPLPAVSQKLHRNLASFVQRPPLFDKPWLSRSVHELWSQRWHQIFRPIFYRIAYKPSRTLFASPAIGRALGMFAVFLMSGLMHDYIMLAMIGRHQWQQPGLLGYQTLFFVIQALASIVSVSPLFPRLPSWLARLLTILFVICTAPLFLAPYLRIKLHLVAEVPGFPRLMDSYIGPVCPYGTAMHP